MDIVSAFEDQMKMVAKGLSPEAKEIVKRVLAVEHRHRFSENRSQLAEEFATSALKAASDRESHS
jgi:hypothetical protein